MRAWTTRISSVGKRLTLALLAAALVEGPARAEDLGAGAWHAPLSDEAVLSLPPLSTALPSPRDFLGYPIGERFTPGHRVADYLEALAAASDRARLWAYGESYEGRPLHFMAISSPANLAAIEEIRERHLARLAKAPQAPLDGVPVETADPVFVWLSYGVHGNEASSTEAAIAAAYVLLAAEGEWAARLERVVVLLDPLTNPDGRARYVHHYSTRSGRKPDASRDAAEHREPWPGGRQNHYLADLNRDWIWLSQIETQHRVAAYQRWEPHVFVDLHEMSPDSSYFFPPSAAPVHPLIDSRTVRWLDTFGRANAAAFEEQGWLFYTGEQYDLFYPGYGDSYPALRHSVGMTYEMAGGGRAGLAVRRRTGSTLRLADRTARHLTTSLSTVRTAADRRTELLRDQIAARTEVLKRPSELYLWPDEDAHAAAAAELLAGHGLTVHRLLGSWTVSATPVGGSEPIRREFPAGTYAVDARQGAGNLVRTLFELEAEIDPQFIAAQRERVEEHRDAQFFDITAWSLPLAFDLTVWKAAGSPGELLGSASLPDAASDASSGASITGEGEFGFLFPAGGLSTFRAAAALQERGISYRQLQPHSAQHGGLFVARRDLGGQGEELVAAIARGSGATAHRVATGYSSDGVPFGSEEHPTIRRSRIGLVLGEGISPTGYGHLWHLLDRTVEAAHHQIRIEDLTASLGELDVVVIPDGEDLGDRLDEAAAGRIRTWIEHGGVLVAIGGAAEWLREGEILDAELWPVTDDTGSPDSALAKPAPVESAPAKLAPADPARQVPGAVLQTEAAEHHPLFAGLEHAPPVLFVGADIWPATGDPSHDLLVAAVEDPVVAGFAWPESKEALAGALLVAEFRLEEGRVLVFSQNPAFRLFWRATMPLFLNAVLHGPSWD